MVSLARDRGRTNTVFDALAHQRRRHALLCLRECEKPMALADLADDVSVREKGTPIDEISVEEIQRIRVSLYHSHIPKLEDADIVEYDRDRNTVALTECTEQFEQYWGLFTGE